jgi:hypothetical protein
MRSQNTSFKDQVNNFHTMMSSWEMNYHIEVYYSKLTYAFLSKQGWKLVGCARLESGFGINVNILNLIIHYHVGCLWW